MATATVMRQQEVLSALVTELANGVDAAVECWMAQVDGALANTRLTSLEKISAVKDIIARYKCLTGKEELHGRES